MPQHLKQWEYWQRMRKNEVLLSCLILAGSPGLGKTDFAREIAAQILCENSSKYEKACGFCSSCQMITKGLHPDFYWVLPEKKEIKVDQIRNLQKNLILAPMIGESKVAIIEKAHLMNTEAQNCFLKTLEEPKGKSLLILIADNPKLLLKTIISRCSVLKFYPPSSQNSLLNCNSDIMDKVASIFAMRAWERFLLAGKLAGKNQEENSEEDKEKKDLISFSANLLVFLEATLQAKLGLAIEAPEKTQKSFPLIWTLPKIVEVISHAQELSRVLLSSSINQRLALENFLISF